MSRVDCDPTNDEVAHHWQLAPSTEQIAKVIQKLKKIYPIAISVDYGV